MKVNISDYDMDRNNSGNRYTVELLFIAEAGEGTDKLLADYIETLRIVPGQNDTTTSGTDPIIIPFGNTTWPGEIAGVTLDAADGGSYLSSIKYGDFEHSEESGTCYRTVTLEYQPPSTGGGTTGRPPGNSTGNDPDAWFPEYQRSTRTIQELLPRPFLGFLDRDEIPFGVITSDNADLKNTEAIDAAEVNLPINSIGQAPDPYLLTDVITYVDTYLEYGSFYADDAETLTLRQNVINDRDLVISVAIGGFTSGIGSPSGYPIKLKYPKGTARLESINLSSEVYQYRDPISNVITYVPYMVRRTQIAVSGFGWTYKMSNNGHMYLDSGDLKNATTENGPVLSPVGLDENGSILPAGQAPGVMVWGSRESDFDGIIGSSYTPGDPAIIIVS